ncbi:MAG: SIS domain-containing protein [Ignavibacteria bacterium]|jgi:arabinose-5-phosphate isomerase
MSKDLHLNDIARQSFIHDIHELQQVSERIDWSSIAKAAEIISISDQVVCIGVGKSAIMAKRCASTLTSIGKKSMFLHPIEALHGDIGIISSGDVVMLFSNSGNTEEVVSIIPYIKTRCKAMIGIIGNVNSAIGTSCDIVIDASIEKESCPLNTVPSSSLLVTTAVTNALIAAITVSSRITKDIFATFHPAGQLGRNLLLTVESVMIAGKDALPFVESTMMLKDVIIMMSKKGLGCAIVSENGRNVLGFITDGDVRRCLQNNDDLSAMKAENIMSYSPITIQPKATLGDALSLMEDREHKIGVLPVCDEQGNCIGIIRLHDIAGHIR